MESGVCPFLLRDSGKCGGEALLGVNISSPTGGSNRMNTTSEPPSTSGLAPTGDSGKRGAGELMDKADPKRPRNEESNTNVMPSSDESTSDGATLTTLPIAKRPAQKGTSGRTVTAISNYYTLKMDNCTRVHEYELIINERRSDGRFKMSAGVKNNILVALREKIGGIFATDTGKVLVSPVKITNPESGEED
eukprot:1271740-Rhodomonas_salina.1